MPMRDLDDDDGARFEPFDGFEDEEPTPVIAAGTIEDLDDAAQLARARAATIPDDDVAALAHDLKNPLTIIMLETTQIEQRLDPTPAPIQRGLERIAQNAAYIDRLVSDLLDMASHEAGKLELRIDTIDVARVLRDAVGRAVPTVDRHRVRLVIGTSCHVEGDEMRIERVVSNLVSNALKYCDGAITVQLEARGSFACVSVIDSGPGLSPDESRTVFDRYRRGATTTSGYGLGLYASRRIIEAHRGRIGVTSHPGHGSRFFFEIPFVRPQGRVRDTK
jgi:signal transduction histidine kinase